MQDLDTTRRKLEYQGGRRKRELCGNATHRCTGFSLPDEPYAQCAVYTPVHGDLCTTYCATKILRCAVLEMLMYYVYTLLSALRAPCLLAARYSCAEVSHEGGVGFRGACFVPRSRVGHTGLTHEEYRPTLRLGGAAGCAEVSVLECPSINLLGAYRLPVL